MARIEIVPMSVLAKWPTWNPWKAEDDLAALQVSREKMKKKMEKFEVNSSKEVQRIKKELELYARK